MLTVSGAWHFGEVFTSWMASGFLCTGQMADSMYGVMGEWFPDVNMLNSSGPWWRWGYCMGMLMWTLNTGAFY